LEIEILEDRCTPVTFSSLNQAFLNSVYIQLFNAPINAAGMATWSAYLQGHTRTDTAYQIEIAAPFDFQTSEINQLYEQLLDRPVDPTGLSAGLKYLRQGGYLQQLAANIAGSSEFFIGAGGGTATGFLDALYLRGLGRPIDTATLSTDQQALTSGITPGQIANGVFHSIEYYSDLVGGYYEQYLQQPVDAAALPGFVSQFQRGAHPEQIISQFLGSDQFFAENALTATSVVASVNPAAFGQTVTFTATVTPLQAGAGTPSGSVVFQDGSTTLGSATLDANGEATFTTSSLSVGSHVISATYGGGSYFGASIGTMTESIVAAASTTALTSSANPSALGQAVTFTATVAASGSGVPTPTGTVTFTDQTTGTTLGTGTLNGSGQATVSTSMLGIGAHNVVASYGGDSNFGSSNGSLNQTVGQSASSTTITSSGNSSVFGQAVTFTATVAASGSGLPTPSGTVTFTDQTTGTTLGSGTLNGSGQATVSTSTLGVGTHNVLAAYGGDSNFGSSNGTLTQTVAQAMTTTAVVSSTNASTGAVTFTATVAPVAPGSGTPSGMVTFTVTDSTGTTVDSGTGTLSNGQATFTSSALTPGTAYKITATYGGDTNFTTSDNTAGPNLVAAATLDYSAPPSLVITLAGFATSPTPTGMITVTFTDQTTPPGTVTSPATPLTAGAATFNTTTLGLTTGDVYQVTILFSGDTSYIMQTNLLTNPATFTA
jgi:hypothetical protein